MHMLYCVYLDWKTCTCCIDAAYCYGVAWSVYMLVKWLNCAGIAAELFEVWGVIWIQLSCEPGQQIQY